MAVPEAKRSLELQTLPPSSNHCFMKPQKMIGEAEDVNFFLTSKAYTDIVAFLLQLNASMFPRKPTSSSADLHETHSDEEQGVDSSTILVNLSDLLAVLGDLVEQAPPDPGPRRFGNISFRKWYTLAEDRTDKLLDSHLPKTLLDRDDWSDQRNGPKLELKAYLLGSFGSAQRLDYGTGHELSFLAFLACIWKLGGFASLPALEAERGIVLGVMQPYLGLVRRLIKTYNLEPAGSHGVWGLDDHSHLPYVFGSAQLAPAITDANSIPAEGSSSSAPDPGDVTNGQVVDKLKGTNMYFGAIGFIYDVKKGPFWEHSRVLYDISGVKAGWAKINKGMIKMYIAEVLSKFPVVQHFPFGHMFKWERDPHAPTSAPTEHLSRQSHAGTTASHRPIASGESPATAAPWASTSLPNRAPTGVPALRPSPAPARGMPPSRTPATASGTPHTKAPWAKDG